MSTGMRMDAKDVGGADVVQAFNFNNVRRIRGERLTREEVLSMNTVNREALVSSGKIREFPIGYGPRSDTSVPVDGELFVCRRADMRYDVVKGHKINVAPLGRSEAERLAHPEVTDAVVAKPGSTT